MKMSSNRERRFEEIRNLLDNLASELSRGIPIIVEGKNDTKALQKLGVAGDIICAKTSGKTLLDVLREIENHGKGEVILLMDFDNRGRELTKRIANDLEKMKIKPNLVFWKRLSGLVGRDVKDIEGLSTYIHTLKSRIGKNISL